LWFLFAGTSAAEEGGTAADWAQAARAGEVGVRGHLDTCED
jgi:hypothetical protein